MSSLQSHIVQIPRNSHFRPVPSLVANAGLVTSSVYTFTADVGVAPRLTSPANLGATGSFSNAPWVISTFSAHGALSSGTGILKDMGETIVSAGRTFRRVQMLVPNNNDFEDQVGGTYTGADSDAYAGYIGPFVRAL
jgi:hypothetical protein